MEDRLWRARLMSLIILGLTAVGVWSSLATVKAESPNLEVSFLDVGQGDATLIETVGGVKVLIDGGPNAGVLRELASELELFDTEIDMVIGTHPDTDHIGGLVDVFERYEVGHVLMTENEGDSPAALAYARAAEDEGAPITMARGGQLWQLDAGTTLEVLFPETNPSQMESNASSIVMKLTYGDTSFMFTGDSPKRIEEYLVLTEGENLEADVLKIGHHGSRTSTSELFLDEVNPSFAVISAEQDSRYGHPHVEVTDLLFNQRVEMLSTAVEGTIVMVSDGQSVRVKQ